jgi:hypothetical protein
MPKGLIFNDYSTICFTLSVYCGPFVMLFKGDWKVSSFTEEPSTRLAKFYYVLNMFASEY